MIKLIKVAGVGSAGVNSDVPPWDLPPEFINDGLNFRVRETKILPFGGSNLIFERPTTAVNSGRCKHVRVKFGDFWVQCTRDSVLYSAVTSGDLWGVINSADYPPDQGGYHLNVNGELRWTISQLGQVIIVNHPEVGPEYVGDPAVQGKLLSLPFNADNTWADLNLGCQVMRVHKNFMVAMNLTGVEDSANGYRISTPADIDGIPYTWDETDRSGLAIRAQLGSDGGQILDGMSLRDEFCMYSRSSIDLLRFDANNPLIWSRRELSSSVGILSTDCVAEVNGAHFLIVDGDIVRNDGTNIKSILDGRLLRRFNSGQSDSTRNNSFVVRNDVLGEVWFCVPEEGSVTANIAYVYNWGKDTFCIRELPAQTVHADYGVDPTGDISPVETQWRNAKGSWGMGSGTWGGADITVIDSKILGLTTAGELRNLDPHNEIDEDGLNMLVERESFPLEGHSHTFMTSRVYPHASGDPFIFQIGAQQFAGGPVTWSTERVFDPNKQRKIDVRVTGEMLAWRVKSIKKNRFIFSGFSVEFSEAGRR